MVTRADDVLNVPTDSTDMAIEQIAFKKIPVPYDDLTPLPQPDRPLIYPDNVPPVLANLNAHNPLGTQAQQLHTDGNHALLVSTVNGGSGGGVARPKSVFSATNWSGFGNLSWPLPNGVRTLYDAHGYVIFPNFGDSSTQEIDIRLSFDDDLQEYIFGSWVVDYSYQNATTDVTKFEFAFNYGTGLDLSQIAPLNTNVALNVGNSGAFRGGFFVQFTYDDFR